MMNTRERREFWRYVRKCAKLVRSWPKWARGGGGGEYNNPKEDGRRNYGEAIVFDLEVK